MALECGRIDDIFFSRKPFFAQVPLLKRVNKDVLKRKPRKEREKDMKNKDCKDELFQETVFMLFALDIVAKLAIYGTAAFLILK